MYNIYKIVFDNQKNMTYCLHKIHQNAICFDCTMIYTIDHSNHYNRKDAVCVATLMILCVIYAKNSHVSVCVIFKKFAGAL